MANQGDARGYTLTPDQWAAIPADWRGVVLRAREDIDDPWLPGTLYTWTGYVPGSGHVPGRLAITAIHLDTPEATRAARIALLARELADYERYVARHPEDAAAGPFVGALRAWLSRERVGDGQSRADDFPVVDALPPTLTYVAEGNRAYLGGEVAPWTRVDTTHNACETLRRREAGAMIYALVRVEERERRDRYNHVAAPGRARELARAMPGRDHHDCVRRFRGLAHEAGPAATDARVGGEAGTDGPSRRML